MPACTLRDQTVIIIGGSSGMGYAVAEGALAEGARVVIGSSSQANVDAAVQRLGAGASGAVLDVHDEASVAAFFAAQESFDHLVFTAGESGGFAPTPLAQLDIDAAGEGLQVRFWGALRAIKHAQPRLSAHGSITLTDGLLAHLPRKGVPLATAFSGAAEHLVRGLAVDLAPIRVNAVCPGPVLTERLAALPAEMIRQMTERQPLPRAAEPVEVAQAFLYLMRGSYTTGQVLIVDGGRMLV
ncbi:SDR family oxidoreductase [Rhodanobacter glycinis]|uniref:NAD(P)-dependent dehydrogenase, short-chain alcohol dehydrogenase family n=1 Tax=Rhodanobacter glycinis TaxID=582702 RepID=A0A1I4BZB7_9GAMM|nr:SDR family oxidoreductase [Rhodanobacter glycinis]SFK74138.1 NAD(P)-dependent dehydrogenase, short-chain alcohol dehydrogenase family [Rhodanobacter glycinis]